MDKYKLHSRVGNSFHFRKVRDEVSFMESFPTTYIPDGTTVMSGDIGNLTFHRHAGLDYGFPDEKTSIGYFDEKVRLGDPSQKITEWVRDEALSDLIVELNENFEGEDADDLMRMTEELQDEAATWKNEHDMIEYLSNQEDGYDFGRWIPGERHTSSFLRLLVILKSMSEQVMEAVRKWAPEIFVTNRDYAERYRLIGELETNPNYAVYCGGMGDRPIRVYRAPNGNYQADDKSGKVCLSREEADEYAIKSMDDRIALLKKQGAERGAK